MKHYVIYIPGIQDDIGRLQSLLIQFWRCFGVKPVMHPFPWAGSESYEVKLKRLLKVIDRLAERNHQVSLVAASAGATAAINAYVQRKSVIHGMVFVCGKINHPHPLGSRVYHHNPAYEVSLREVANSLTKLELSDKAKMLSLYSPMDQTVPPADSRIPGARNEALSPRRHGRAILHTISFGSGRIMRFLGSL